MYLYGCQCRWFASISCFFCLNTPRHADMLWFVFHGNSWLELQNLGLDPEFVWVPCAHVFNCRTFWRRQTNMRSLTFAKVSIVWWYFCWLWRCTRMLCSIDCSDRSIHGHSHSHQCVAASFFATKSLHVASLCMLCMYVLACAIDFPKCFGSITSLCVIISRLSVSIQCAVQFCFANRSASIPCGQIQSCHAVAVCNLEILCAWKREEIASRKSSQVHLIWSYQMTIQIIESCHKIVCCDACLLTNGLGLIFVKSDWSEKRPKFVGWHGLVLQWWCCWAHGVLFDHWAPLQCPRWSINRPCNFALLRAHMHSLLCRVVAICVVFVCSHANT